MIYIYRLKKRQVDRIDKVDKNAPKEFVDFKVFATAINHAVGTIDFSELELKLSDEKWDEIVKNSTGYAKEKLSRLNEYFEIEINITHKSSILAGICECELKNLIKNLNDGYLTIKKIG